MSRFLGLALVAEGPTDQRFFRPLLRRLAETICANRANGVVEIAEVLELTPEPARDGRTYVDRVCDAAWKAYEGWHVLFVHSDGAGDPVAAERERIAPIREAFEPPDARRVVGVVPVRGEMEAWAIADGRAVRTAFGTTRSDADLGLPARPADVESDPDPKQSLNAALRVARGGRRRRRSRSTTAFLDLIAEHIRFTVLREVPAFARTEERLLAALQELGFVQPGNRA